MIGYRSAEKRKKCYHDTEIVGIDWCIDGFGINRTAVEVRLETMATQERRCVLRVELFMSALP